MRQAESVVGVLKSFVDAIDSSGGVVYVQDEGVYTVPAPAFAPHLLDLGQSYADACRLLGRSPKVQP